MNKRYVFSIVFLLTTSMCCLQARIDKDYKRYAEIAEEKLEEAKGLSEAAWEKVVEVANTLRTRTDGNFDGLVNLFQDNMKKHQNLLLAKSSTKAQEEYFKSWGNAGVMKKFEIFDPVIHDCANKADRILRWHIEELKAEAYETLAEIMNLFLEFADRGFSFATDEELKKGFDEEPLRLKKEEVERAKEELESWLEQLKGDKKALLKAFHKGLISSAESVLSYKLEMFDDDDQIKNEKMDSDFRKISKNKLKMEWVELRGSIREKMFEFFKPINHVFHYSSKDVVSGWTNHQLNAVKGEINRGIESGAYGAFGITKDKATYSDAEIKAIQNKWKMGRNK